MNTLNPTATKD